MTLSFLGIIAQMSFAAVFVYHCTIACIDRVAALWNAITVSLQCFGMQ